MNKLLVVDDELSIRESFSLILGSKYKLMLAASGEAALKYAADQKIDLAFLDIRMPGLDGLATLKRLKEIDPELEVVMVTAVNDVQKAGEAIKYGARNYLIKPFDVQAILKMTESILRRKSLIIEEENIRKETDKKQLKLIGQSEKIEEIFQSIKKIAAKDLRVLVLGEPGTERAAVAELVHEASQRAELPMRALNLTEAMSAAEVKNLVFGSEQGSTTADLKKKSGLIDEARGGTVFIDHIEYLPAGLFKQPVEPRLVAGGAPDLAERSRENYEFFSAALITLPPLRERISDLPLLINHFIELYSEEYGKEITGVAPEVEEIFGDYSWPGNTAQLNAVIRNLVLKTTTDRLKSDDLPLDLLLRSSAAAGGEYFSSFEKTYIQNIIDWTGGDKERAAAVLQMSPALL
jgi:two-component system, NtrC family, response regulator AtoC